MGLDDATQRAKESANRAAVRGWLHAREGKINLEELAQFLTDDATRFGPRPSFIGGGPLESAGYDPGPAQGRDRLVAGFGDDVLPYQPGSISVEVENIIAEDDY